ARRQEVDLAIGRQRRQETGGALVCLVNPLGDLVGGSRLARVSLTRVLHIYVEERAAPSFEAVRQLLHKMLHPERNVAEHRLVGPAGGCRLGQRLETKAA